MKEEQIICPAQPELFLDGRENITINFPGLETPLFDPDDLEQEIILFKLVHTQADLDAHIRTNELSVWGEEFDFLPNEQAIALSSNILSSLPQKRRMQLVGIDTHILPGGYVIVHSDTENADRSEELRQLFGEPIRRVLYREKDTENTGEVVVYQKPN